MCAALHRWSEGSAATLEDLAGARRGPVQSRANRKALRAPPQSNWSLGETSFRRHPRSCCSAARRYKNPACQPVGSRQFRPGHSAKGRGSRDVIVTAIGLRGQSGHRTGSETQISPGRRDVRSQLASRTQPSQAQSPDSSVQRSHISTRPGQPVRSQSE